VAQNQSFEFPQDTNIKDCIECSSFKEVVERAKGRRFAEKKMASSLLILLEKMGSYTNQLERCGADLNKRIEELTILKKVSDALLKTNDLEKSLKLILTGVTAGEAFGFNRAFVFLVNEKNKTLEGKMALGPVEAKEAFTIWTDLKKKNITFDQLIDDILNGEKKEPDELNDITNKISIPLKFQGGTTTTYLVNSLKEKKSYNLRNPDLNSLDHPVLQKLLDQKGFTIVPILYEDKAIGVLIADNFVTKKPITDEDVSALETFANQAAYGIANILLNRELDSRLKELEHINQLLRENQNYIIRFERFADMGKLATTAAHEIKTPLIAIGGYARRALKKYADSDLNELKVILKEVERLENITSQILDYSKELKLNLEDHNPNEIVMEALDFLKDRFKYNNVVLKTKLSSEVARVKVDPQRIKQVLFNLLENAYEAMPGGGTLTVGTKNQDDYMVLEIEDTGYGIPEEEMKNLFTPFYSTKASGAGLGLPVSKKIITDHNGFIQVESKINQGTKFSIYLPLNPSSIKQGGDEDV
jgi:hypothetical protein